MIDGEVGSHLSIGRRTAGQLLLVTGLNLILVLPDNGHDLTLR